MHRRNRPDLRLCLYRLPSPADCYFAVCEEALCLPSGGGCNSDSEADRDPLRPAASDQARCRANRYDGVLQFHDTTVDDAAIAAEAEEGRGVRSGSSSLKTGSNRGYEAYFWPNWRSLANVAAA